MKFQRIYNDGLGISNSKKIWIDLDNSPHVPFFRPIIAELEKRGYPVMLTVRDCFQVCGLMNLFNLEYRRIGKHSGKNKVRKMVGLLYRALQLWPIASEEEPVLALSHGSRSQMILARMLGIPSVLCSDYEWGREVPFIHPNWLIVPEVIPDREFQINKGRILKYPGIKEDVYVPFFKPDPSLKDVLGLDERNLIITIRPPATEAHYHNPQSEELFKAAVNLLGHRQNTCILLLPRGEKQTDSIRKLWPEWCANGKIIIPNCVVDGLNLIWHSDFVISGGGTMNREAAALGVPVYSIFLGKIGAVDRYLRQKGRLTLLGNINDIRSKLLLVKRDRKLRPECKNNGALESILGHILRVLEEC